MNRFGLKFSHRDVTLAVTWLIVGFVISSLLFVAYLHRKMGEIILRDICRDAIN